MTERIEEIKAKKLALFNPSWEDVEYLLAALEETQHQLHDQEEALIAANGLIEDLQIQLEESQQQNERLRKNFMFSGSALAEAQQTITRKKLYIEKLELSRESAQQAADNISKEKGLELYEARQTIARQREALTRINDLHVRGIEDKVCEPFRKIAKVTLEGSNQA